MSMPAFDLRERHFPLAPEGDTSSIIQNYFALKKSLKRVWNKGNYASACKKYNKLMQNYFPIISTLHFYTILVYGKFSN